MMDENKRENIENEIEPTEEAQTATDEVTLEEAPIEASAVLACVTSTPVTVIGFDRYSETVALKPL